MHNQSINRRHAFTTPRFHEVTRMQHHYRKFVILTPSVLQSTHPMWNTSIQNERKWGMSILADLRKKSINVPCAIVKKEGQTCHPHPSWKFDLDQSSTFWDNNWSTTGPLKKMKESDIGRRYRISSNRSRVSYTSRVSNRRANTLPDC